MHDAAINSAQPALHIRTQVLPGHRIDITAPQLPEGDFVEVIVVLPEAHAPARQSVLEFLDSLPLGPRSFPTWEEFETHFQQERDAWDR